MRGGAGRCNKPFVLAYLGLIVGSAVVWQLTVGRKYPDLARERLHPGPGAKDSLARDLAIGLPPMLAHYGIAALDAARFHWSDRVPLPARVAGLLGMTVSMAVLIWATWVNPFFSSVVRIQRERGHRLVTNGPYRFVRHPGYTAAIVYSLCSSLVLGSWLSLLPLLGWFAFLLQRTRLEDRVLTEELEGYPEYARRVRYRLLPGLW
jgi:protein-S-isoprenylcysteine O-methyltransferase Ste14